MKYTIIKDSREKLGWDFAPDNFCKEMRVEGLYTGDYTVEGLEKVLCIERKRNTSEISINLLGKDKRFYDELERMSTFKYAYIIYEFGFADIVNFPYNSGMPYSIQKSIKITGGLLLKTQIEIQLKFPFIQFVYAGNKGKEYALSLMKRVVEREKKNG